MWQFDNKVDPHSRHYPTTVGPLFQLQCLAMLAAYLEVRIIETVENIPSELLELPPLEQHRVEEAE